MQLTNIGKNKTMITHKVMHESKEFTTDYDVYFSYSQPVVVVDWRNRTVYKLSLIHISEPTRPY